MNTRVRTTATATLAAALLLVPVASAFADEASTPAVTTETTASASADPQPSDAPTAEPTATPSATAAAQPTESTPAPAASPSPAAAPAAAPQVRGAQMLGASPASVVLSQPTYSLTGYAGLNFTSTISIKNTSATAMTGVYLTFVQGNTDVKWSLPSPSDPTYGSPTCSISAPGAPIVCGPYNIAAGATLPVKIAPNIPQDYLLKYGQVPLTYTATITAASSGGTPLDVTTTPIVYNAKTTILTSAGPAITMTQHAVSTSPGSTILNLVVANQDYTMAQKIVATMTLPTGVALDGDLPDGCTIAGSVVTCTYLNLASAYQTNWLIPVKVAAGFPIGTVIPRISPTAVQTSTLEPVTGGYRTSWPAQVYYAPFDLTIVGPVDVAANITGPATTTGGSTVTYPVTISDATGKTNAKAVTGTINLTGLGAASVTTDIPGCTVVDNATITCALGNINAGAGVSGGITVTFPSQGDADQTLTIAGSFHATGQADADESDNSFSTSTLLPHAPKANLHVTYLDADGNDLAPATDSTATPGDDYTVRAPAIAGFHLVSASDTVTGTYGADASTTDVEFDYAADVAHLHVTYVDGAGNPVAAPDDINGAPGADYTVEPKSVDGHHVVSTPANGEGVYGADGSTTQIVFTYGLDVAHLHVTYLDENGNDLAPADDSDAMPGTSYTLAAKAILGFHVTSQALVAGQYDADGSTTTVTFVYEKDGVIVPPVDPIDPVIPAKPTDGTITPPAKPSQGAITPPAKSAGGKIGSIDNATTGSDSGSLALLSLAGIGTGLLGLVIRRRIARTER